MVKISQLIEASGADLVGDRDFEVASIAAKPEESQANQVALIFDSNPARAKKKLDQCKAGTIFLSRNLKSETEILSGHKANLLFVDRPRYALKQIMDLFAPVRTHSERGIHRSAIVDPSAQIHPSAAIGPFVYVGPRSIIGANTKLQARVTVGADAKIGSDGLFYSGVVVEDHTVIGDRVIVQANSVIGSDGYSYVTREPSNLEKLRSGDFNLNFDRQVQEKITAAGNVIIGDDVEIGSNTSIDRGTIGPTTIGDGTKIDNLCQIAHNVQIGKDCLIIANVGIAGSAKIGDRVTMAGGSGCGDGVELGHDVIVTAYSAVNSDVGPLRPVMGVPAIDHAEFIRRQRVYVRLPKLQEDIRQLKQKIK